MRDYFRVAFCREAMPFFEGLAQFAIIIYFAVENHGDSFFLVEAGLMSSFEINYRKPAGGEANFLRGVEKKALLVWAAVADFSGHRLQLIKFARAQKSGYAAHTCLITASFPLRYNHRPKEFFPVARSDKSIPLPARAV